MGHTYTLHKWTLGEAMIRFLYEIMSMVHVCWNEAMLCLTLLIVKIQIKIMNLITFMASKRVYFVYMGT